MTKSEIIDSIIDRAGITRSAATKALEATIDSIRQALIAGDAVHLRSLGTLKIKESKRKNHYNPQKGKLVTIEPKRTVKYIVSVKLKEELNQ